MIPFDGQFAENTMFDVSDSSGRPIAFGVTDTDRFIAVVFEVLNLADPLVIRRQLRSQVSVALAPELIDRDADRAARRLERLAGAKDLGEGKVVSRPWVARSASRVTPVRAPRSGWSCSGLLSTRFHSARRPPS